MNALNRRGAAKALGVAVLGGAAAVAGAPKAQPSSAVVDPIVNLWAKTQVLNAEWDRVSTEQENLRKLIVSRRPAQPQGVTFVEWHQADPDTARCTALCERSEELGTQTCDHYDKIAVAVAVTSEGVRAKAAAALSLWVQEKHLSDEIWHYDLILNALREAAAGSTVA